MKNCYLLNESAMNEPTSLYPLIIKLCSSLLKESEESVEDFSLKRAKSVAFDVLLHKKFDEISDDEQLLNELQFASFELMLANKKKDSMAVNEFIEEFKKKPNELESIVWLLVHLKNIDPDPDSEKKVRIEMKIVE